MDGNKPHILIVDDEIGPRESLKVILSPYYNVHIAEGGGRAVQMLQQFPVDLVTLDLKMPGMAGIDVLARVKQHDPDIEAIIITGYGSLDTAIEGLRLDAFDYIAKPFDVHHILALVERGLERRRTRLRLKKVRSDFISNVSHELRTPLSVVVGFVHLLLNQVLGKLTQDQEKVLQTVYRNSEELLELIDNVLWLTTLNSGDAGDVIDEFDVRMVVQEALQRREAVIRDKKLTLTTEIPDSSMVIINDRLKVDRIFQNVFNNAVKFTNEGSIRVTVRAGAEKHGVEVEVADTGVGIDTSKLASVIEPFQQVEGAVERACAGLGLGLTVAYRITQMLGGTLCIESELGIGTTVKLKLPARNKDAKASEATERLYG
jgi:two-component system, sensor histidine kinase and response regulator